MADVKKYVSGVDQLVRSEQGKLLSIDIALPFFNGNRRLNRLHHQLAESVKNTSSLESFCSARLSDDFISIVISTRLHALESICLNDSVSG